MIPIIQDRLESYKTRNPVEAEQATKEILQEVALYALWRARFFEIAAFQGGTSLRILHRLPRFSEDLDFMLKQPDESFNWSSYLKSIQVIFAEFGIYSEVLPKGRMDKSIRQAIIKDKSIANQLDLSFQSGDISRKLKIKLEIDVQPPKHSGYQYSFLDFPLDYEVCHQDLASNFALKIHAILCRGFLKGRDWYDFSWYTKNKVFPNLEHLNSALQQFGPWSNSEDLAINIDWLEHELRSKIDSIDWAEAKADVSRFLQATELESLALWSDRFFNSKVDLLVTPHSVG